MMEARLNTGSAPDFQVLFESAPGLFLVLDPGLKIIAVSDAYLNATKTKRADIIGQHIFSAFPDNPSDPQATGVNNLRTSLERVLATHLPDTMAVQKYDIRRPDSEGGGFEERYWSPVNTPVFSSTGDLLYIIHRVEDVTEFIQLKKRGTEEHKLTEELKSQAERMAAEVYERAHELQDLNKQLRASNEALVNKESELQTLYGKLLKLDQQKTQFFANVSHELRTPLALILGPVQKMLTSALPACQEKDLQIVARNARTLLKHVNDLLDISKLDAGKMAIHYEDVDLARLVRQIASNFDGLAQERNYRYSVNTPESLWTRVDAEKFQRILLNLLSNAFKFTPAGGTILCSLSSENGELVITVADSGPGIPEALRASIFERFFQVEDSSTRSHGGTGLGLSIVKDFVALHEGTVTAGQAPEGGALFKVVLPFKGPLKNVGETGAAALSETTLQQAVEELGPTESQPSTPAVAGDRPLILVVEDNQEMNSYICETLWGRYRTVSAFHGKEGLEKALQLQPDLILTDLMMPIFNGAQMIEELKKAPETKSIPVIVLSARLDDEMRISTLKRGAQDYIVKPFSAEELTARIQNAVTAKKVRELLQWELTSSQNDLMVLAKQLAHQSHELQQSLELTRAAMQEANRASQVRTRFLANISHEIRTPLGIVLGFAELLSTPSLDPSEKDEFFEKMRQSGQHLAQILNDIVEVAKIEAGHLEVASKPIPTEDFLKEFSRLFAEKAQAKGLAFEIRQNTNLPPQFCSDIDKLRQVLTNLVDNAIKFSRRGKVSLTVGVSQEASLELQFMVQDQGPGIHSDYQAHLFEVFSQENGSLTRQHGGLGLGLALSHRLAAALGGQLQLAKTGPDGTLFVLNLPLDGAAASVESGASKVVSIFSKAVERRPLQDVRILIVDDSRDIQVFVGQILKNAGALTESAVDGVEGVKKALSGTFNIILMDMQMPNMDGYEATSVLRSKGVVVPIIAVTAHAMAEDRERCLAAGCSEYLAKPVDGPTLVGKILEQLASVGSKAKSN